MALGLVQPLEALALDARKLQTATEAAVTYCNAQGATSFAVLVERASTWIVHHWRTHSIIVPWGVSSRGPRLRPCDALMPLIPAAHPGGCMV